MFEGFEERRVRTGEAELYLRLGGAGPALLLLHGYPQDHCAWHALAPLLREHFTLVVPDLRGYGRSRGPAPDADGLNYAKRVMAEDMCELMSTLGHERFALAGHDRGARVAYRLALDHPARVTRLAVLDIVPTVEVWERMRMSSALSSYHWPFLAQPAPLPETLIGHDPEFYLHHLLQRWAGRPDALDPRAVASYVQSFRRPEVIRATCADYRAGAGVDVEHDRADREAGRRIACPVLFAWGRRYLNSKATAPFAIWQEWAVDVRELALDCGHFLAEEEPAACAAALREFFAA